MTYIKEYMQMNHPCLNYLTSLYPTNLLNHQIRLNHHCNLVRNTPFSNERIQEEEESISNANNVTANTLSHTFNTQKENANMIFTSNKKYKFDNLAYALNDLTIIDVIYYVSNSATASDA